MSRNKSSVRPERNGERGQSLFILAGMLVGLLGMAAFVIDIGHLYYSYQELQSATQSAALAGAQTLETASAFSTAAAAADLYSGESAADYNYRATLDITSVTPSPTSPACLVSTGVVCYPAGNAIQVTEKASVPMFFAKIFGVSSLNITSTATASAAGGGGGPYNVVMVLDTTASMNTNDADCGNITQEQCALGGIRTLLSKLDPCAATLASCPAAVNHNVPNAVDEVGLLVFPGLTPTENTTLNNPPIQAPSASDDYTCPNSNPPTVPYNENPGYLVLPLQSDYRTSDRAVLNTSSQLVIASGGNGSRNCQGVQAPGGQGTFYAGAIDAAQNYLVANSRANVKNVMVLLSDGDATADTTQMGGTATSYPSTNECHQAVTEANKAKTAGTLIYSVSYGSETSGCNAQGESGITPCQTMAGIASLPLSTYFFSNATSGGGVVCAGGRPNSSLTGVFTQIAGDLTLARLIPNGTQ